MSHRIAAIRICTIVVSLMATPLARALTVTACASDVQPGGTNLQQALQAGGVITFQCGAKATIDVHASHIVSKQVEVDGGGRVTLRLLQGQFGITGAGPDLVLRNIGLEGSGGLSPQFRLAGGRMTFDHVQSRNLGVEASGGRVEIRSTTMLASRLGLLDCTLAIADSRFESMDARAAGLDGGALSTNCTGSVERSDFIDNKARSGGAVAVTHGGPGTLTFTSVRLENNEAAVAGGGMHVGSPTILGNASGPKVSLVSASFLRNRTGGDGGGLYASGVAIAAARFNGNVATGRGGALFANGGNVVKRALLVNNSAGAEGGAIYAVSSRFANTLVARNEAPAGAGIIGGNVSLVNVTVAGNGGTGIDTGSFVHGFTLTNVLLVNNRGANCGSSALPLTSAFVVQGPTLQHPGATCGAHIPQVDPALDPMYAPVAGSPARQGGELAACVASPVDGQDVYGEARPQGTHCSIGAVEGPLDRLVYRRLRDPGPVDPELLARLRRLADALMHR